MKFVHVPKTGGTSIIHALKLDNKGHYTLDKYTPNTFTVVRNPFDRLVSSLADNHQLPLLISSVGPPLCGIFLSISILMFLEDIKRKGGHI